MDVASNYFHIYFFCWVYFNKFFFITQEEEDYTYIQGIFGIIFVLSGISLFCVMYNNIYFIMGPNTLTVMKKAQCRKKVTIYNPVFYCRLILDYLLG